jgi:hypothetical protein
VVGYEEMFDRGEDCVAVARVEDLLAQRGVHESPETIASCVVCITMGAMRPEVAAKIASHKVEGIHVQERYS